MKETAELVVMWLFIAGGFVTLGFMCVLVYAAAKEILKD